MTEFIQSLTKAYSIKSDENSKGFTRKTFALHIQEIGHVFANSTKTTKSSNWIFTADLNLAEEFSLNSEESEAMVDVGTYKTDIGAFIPEEVFKMASSSELEESLRLIHTVYNIDNSLFQPQNVHLSNLSIASLILSVHIDTTIRLVNFSQPAVFLFQKSLVSTLAIYTCY